uniref:Gustatory receptor n=1 Tax=Heliothis virescens TaxID=7102 RepID=A0A2A4J8P1_HELVI
MELSLSNSKITKSLNIEDFGYSKSDSNKALCKMEKVMNLYHNMIKAYNYLIEAVKWQLLVTIVSAFLNILSCCYRVSLTVIKEDVPLSFIITYVGLLAGIMLPLFAPCMLGDQVHNEVRRLRELLASRLYENQLDKLDRCKARALLAWTETRNLSFSLLCMFDIDISLPFKFIGFLITYLIILLQFQRVMNPN